MTSGRPSSRFSPCADSSLKKLGSYDANSALPSQCKPSLRQHHRVRPRFISLGSGNVSYIWKQSGCLADCAICPELAYSSITLHAFHLLESLAFEMTEEGINGVQLARVLDSISSLNFSLLALDVCSREKRQADCRDAQTKGFLGEMKALDQPLCRLANRALQGTGERFTLILLANNPNAVHGSFAEFRKVGNTWKGAKLIGSRGYYWTFEAAKDCEDRSLDDSVLRFICI